MNPVSTPALLTHLGWSRASRPARISSEASTCSLTSPQTGRSGVPGVARGAAGVPPSLRLDNRCGFASWVCRSQPAKSGRPSDPLSVLVFREAGGRPVCVGVHRSPHRRLRRPGRRILRASGTNGIPSVAVRHFIDAGEDAGRRRPYARREASAVPLLSPLTGWVGMPRATSGGRAGVPPSRPELDSEWLRFVRPGRSRPHDAGRAG